LQRKYCISNRT